MPDPPSGPAPAAAAQAEEAEAEVVEEPPTTFLPGPQPLTDIQPEPAVRPPRFTATAAKSSGKCSLPARHQATGLSEQTTRSSMHRAALAKRRGERRVGRPLPEWAGPGGLGA